MSLKVWIVTDGENSFEGVFATKEAIPEHFLEGGPFHYSAEEVLLVTEDTPYYAVYLNKYGQGFEDPTPYPYDDDRFNSEELSGYVNLKKGDKLLLYQVHPEVKLLKEFVK